jgi:MEMO1 family protein
MVRQTRFAGSFYPPHKTDLANTIQGFLDEVEDTHLDSKPKALIVPHAGYIYSGLTAAYGYRTLLAHKYSKVIILGLSHRVAFEGLAGCSFDSWQTPLRDIRTESDTSTYRFLSGDGMQYTIHDEAHEIEHSIEVQLPFLQMVSQNDFEILPILTGSNVDIEKSVEFVSELLDQETLLIVSSDLSHYLPYPVAVEKDTRTIEKILNRETLTDRESACGVDGINIVSEVAKLKSWKVRKLNYRNSGDLSSLKLQQAGIAGDKDQVVGYASIVFYE